MVTDACISSASDLQKYNGSYLQHRLSVLPNQASHGCPRTIRLPPDTFLIFRWSLNRQSLEPSSIRRRQWSSPSLGHATHLQSSLRFHTAFPAVPPIHRIAMPASLSWGFRPSKITRPGGYQEQPIDCTSTEAEMSRLPNANR